MWGIGVDIVEVHRFRALDYAKNKEFYNRIFTPREIKYCLSFKNPAQHFAATFAGKESVYKAINRRINIKPHRIEIVRDGKAPRVNLVMDGCGGSDKTNPSLQIKVTLSHTSSYAVAFALAVFEEPEQVWSSSREES
ncbi:MAG: holo-ACP synthase [Candidatus Bathyarchaeota archaeon]|nr:holo-ACP synthase [Candidatus Bathyarchaeota archaeon]